MLPSPVKMLNYGKIILRFTLLLGLLQAFIPFFLDCASDERKVRKEPADYMLG